MTHDRLTDTVVNSIQSEPRHFLTQLSVGFCLSTITRLDQEC